MSLKNVEKQEKNVAVLEISVDKETFAAATQRAYLKNRKNIQLQGFRKGKAPRKMIETIYGKGVFYDDAIQETYEAAYLEALKEFESEGNQVVSRPELSIQDVGDEGYTFTAKVALKPEVKISSYKGLEGEYTDPAEVTDDDVDKVIENRRKQSARQEAKEGAAELGDTVVIDYKGTVDGEAFAGGTAENHNLKLGSGSFIPGFEDQLVGKSAGEEYSLTVTFPEDYHAEELAGKEAVFTGVIHEVKTEILPELDDDFASDVSDFETMAEYRADEAEKLRKQRQENANNAFEDSLVEKLVSVMEVDIPDAMIDMEVDNQVENQAYSMQMQGISMDDYFKYTGMTMDTFRSMLRPQAEGKVKSTLALEFVAKAEGLEVTEEDLEAEYQKIADNYEMDVSEVKERAPKEEISQSLLMRKAIAVVRENGVKVAPKPVEEAADEVSEEASEEEKAEE